MTDYWTWFKIGVDNELVQKIQHQATIHGVSEHEVILEAIAHYFHPALSYHKTESAIILRTRQITLDLLPEDDKALLQSQITDKELQDELSFLEEEFQTKVETPIRVSAG